jgi:arylformamidase
LRPEDYLYLCGSIELTMARPDIIDLSHTINATISVYPGSDHPVLKNTALLEQKGYREKELILSTHHGTHIDCPFHLLSQGFHTGNAPLYRFSGKGFVMDCRAFAPDDKVTSGSLRSLEPEIAGTDFLLLLTGMDRHWKSPDYAGKYPVLDNEAAEYLAQFHLKGIGIDALSIDPVEDTGLAVHKTLLSGNIIIIENLTGLEKLLNREFLFCCFPLKIEEGDGSPVRACAIMEQGVYYSPPEGSGAG